MSKIHELLQLYGVCRLCVVVDMRLIQSKHLNLDSPRTFATPRSSCPQQKWLCPKVNRRVEIHPSSSAFLTCCSTSIACCSDNLYGLFITWFCSGGQVDLVLDPIFWENTLERLEYLFVVFQYVLHFSSH